MLFEHHPHPDMYIDAGVAFVHVHRAMLQDTILFRPLRTFFDLVDHGSKKVDRFNDDPVFVYDKVSDRQWELMLSLIYYP